MPTGDIVIRSGRIAVVHLGVFGTVPKAIGTERDHCDRGSHQSFARCAALGVSRIGNCSGSIGVDENDVTAAPGIEPEVRFIAVCIVRYAGIVFRLGIEENLAPLIKIELGSRGELFGYL